MPASVRTLEEKALLVTIVLMAGRIENRGFFWRHHWQPNLSLILLANPGFTQK
jgi:hypothetical protein